MGSLLRIDAQGGDAEMVRQRQKHARVLLMLGGKLSGYLSPMQRSSSILTAAEVAGRAGQGAGCAHARAQHKTPRASSRPPKAPIAKRSSGSPFAGRNTFVERDVAGALGGDCVMAHHNSPAVRWSSSSASASSQTHHHFHDQCCIQPDKLYSSSKNIKEVDGTERSNSEARQPPRYTTQRTQKVKEVVILGHLAASATSVSNRHHQRSRKCDRQVRLDKCHSGTRPAERHKAVAGRAVPARASSSLDPEAQLFHRPSRQRLHRQLHVHFMQGQSAQSAPPGTGSVPKETEGGGRWGPQAAGRDGPPVCVAALRGRLGYNKRKTGRVCSPTTTRDAKGRYTHAMPRETKQEEPALCAHTTVPRSGAQMRQIGRMYGWLGGTGRGLPATRAPGEARPGQAGAGRQGVRRRRVPGPPAGPACPGCAGRGVHCVCGARRRQGPARPQPWQCQSAASAAGGASQAVPASSKLMPAHQSCSSRGPPACCSRVCATPGLQASPGSAEEAMQQVLNSASTASP